ncbi:MAG: DUF1127 domain-containing protein [Pseudomonas sp.]
MRELSDVYVGLRERQELLAPHALAEAEGLWHRFWRRLQTRRQLLVLDARLLDDIGLSAEQARKEATRPFWQLLR